MKYNPCTDPASEAPALVPPVADKPWRVHRKDVKYGDEFYVEPGHASWVCGGWVKVVRVLVDNTDNCPEPYYEVTVSYTYEPHPNRVLHGPEIDYHLRRHAPPGREKP